MISIDGLAVEFSGTTLFKDINFVVNDKDRIALMGKNGAGKSTLLKILAGVQTPTNGKISAPKDAVIAYLPQHLMVDNKRSLFEEASQAFAEVLDMQILLDELNHQLTVRTDYESDEYSKIIEQVSQLSEKLYSQGEINFDAEVEKILLGLGLRYIGRKPSIASARTEAQ